MKFNQKDSQKEEFNLDDIKLDNYEISGWKLIWGIITLPIMILKLVYSILSLILSNLKFERKMRELEIDLKQAASQEEKDRIIKKVKQDIQSYYK